MQISTLTNENDILEIVSALKDTTTLSNNSGALVRQGKIDNKEVITIEALKDRKKVARAGWNGKGMYVELSKGGDYEFSELLPFFVLKGVNNAFNTWVASVSDTLAEDWQIVE